MALARLFVYVSFPTRDERRWDRMKPGVIVLCKVHMITVKPQGLKVDEIDSGLEYESGMKQKREREIRIIRIITINQCIMTVS